MPLVMPNGSPNPYQQGLDGTPATQNPWAQQGLDPTQRQKAGQKGSFQQAQEGLNYYAKQKGKTIGQDQWNQIGQATGYKGGDVSAEQYNSAMDYLDKQWGGQSQPKPQENLDGNPVEKSIEQWKQQKDVAGVPGSFKQNPMYGQQTALMQRILSNPQTMGQQQQDMLMERQKESANSMMKQLQGQGQQQMMQRGFGANGQQAQAQNQQLQGQMAQQLLSGRRDIALQAAQQNRQDELNALNASLGLNQQEYAQDMGLSQQALGQMNQNRQSNMNEMLGKHGMDMDIKNWQTQKDQFGKTFGLDFLRYLQQGDQFNRSLGENQRQYNGNMGLNWSQFNAAQQQGFLDMIMKGYI